MTSVTKSWRDLPAAHRQWGHEGHCRLIHGHSWGFDVTFVCDAVDKNGFVIDVGELGEVTKRLKELFDHTLLINRDDPHVDVFKEIHNSGYANVVFVQNCGMESLAELVALEVGMFLEGEVNLRRRRVRVTEVTCHEDSKNSATYIVE